MIKVYTIVSNYFYIATIKGSADIRSWETNYSPSLSSLQLDNFTPSTLFYRVESPAVKAYTKLEK